MVFPFYLSHSFSSLRIDYLIVINNFFLLESVSFEIFVTVNVINGDELVSTVIIVIKLIVKSLKMILSC